jgi:hypothetical protein
MTESLNFPTYMELHVRWLVSTEYLHFLLFLALLLPIGSIAANIKSERLQSIIKFIQILEIFFKDLITLT